MKKILFIIILISVTGCLVPPAPHIYNYIPATYDSMEKYNPAIGQIPYLCTPYYYSKSLDNHTKIHSLLEIISLSKLKTVRLRVKINKKDKPIEFDSVFL